MRIKEILKEKGMSVSELAEKMGISRVSLSTKINGNPTLDTLKKIASVLGVPVSELFSKSGGELISLTEFRDHYYTARSIEELEEVLNKIKREAGQD